MLARQLAYITYVRGSMSTLQILLFLYFYGFMPPTLSREEPFLKAIFKNSNEFSVQGSDRKDGQNLFSNQHHGQDNTMPWP